MSLFRALMNISLLYVFSVSSLSAQVQGDEQDEEGPKKKDLIISHFQDPQFDQLTNERLRKIILRVSAKQQTYHLTFANQLKSSKNKNNAARNKGQLELRLAYDDSPRGLAIVAGLYQPNGEKAVKRVSKKNFRPRETLIVTEKALEVLFNLSPEEEARPPKEKNTAGSIPKEKIKSGGPVAEPQALAFKERILGLKDGISKEFKDIKEKDKETSGGDEEALDKKKKNSAKLGSFSLENKNEDERKRKKKNSKSNWIFSKKASLGFESQSVTITDREETVAEVAIRTSMGYLDLGYSFEIKHAKFSRNTLEARFNYLYPVVEDESVAGQSVLNYLFGWNYTIGGFGFSAAYAKESLMYAALPRIGEGLELAVVDISFLKLKAEKNLFDKASLGIGYDLLLFASSEEERHASEFEASGVFVEAIYNFGDLFSSELLQNLSIGLRAKQMSFSSFDQFGLSGTEDKITFSVFKKF